MPKKKPATRYISIMQRFRDKAFDWAIPVVLTAVLTAIGSFVTFTRLGNAAITTTFANAERLTAIESKLETDYLPRTEADLRSHYRDEQLSSLQQHFDKRIDEVIRLLKD